MQLTAVKAYSGDLVIQNDDVEDVSMTALKKERNLVSHINSSSIAHGKLAASQKSADPNATVLKLLQDVKTRWGSILDLIERVVKLEDSLKHMFQQEFRNRATENQPTLLEG